MAFTLNGGAQFPEGTSVGVYLRTQWPVESLSGAPSGSAVETQTITGGSATFSTVADNTQYVAYANVGGQDRFRRFFTATPAPSAGSGGPGFRGSWAPATAYKANETVLAPDGTLQAAKADFTSGNTFNPANWTSLTQVRAAGLEGDEFIALSDRQWSAYSALSNGTDTAGNAKIRHVPCDDAQSIRLVFNNFAGLNQITVRAAVESPNGGTPIPVWFNGKRDIVLDIDGYVVSDPVGVKVTKGTAFYTRTFVTVTSGQKWKIQISATETGELVETGTAVTDKTTSGTIIQGASSFAYGPQAVLYRPGRRVPAVAMLGDSIIEGGRNPAVYYWRNFSQGAVSCMHAGLGGNTLQSWNADGVPQSATGFATLRRAIIAGANHVVCELGTNDRSARTAAQMQADMIAIWRQITSLGAKAWQCTIFPRSTSTDSFATTVNQTAISGEANRVTVNDWLRDGAPLDNATSLTAVATGTAGALRSGQVGHPLTGGVFEIADTVESARNSGVWKAPSYTTDGIHPTDSAMNLVCVTPTNGAILAASFT